jgi:hypothetical protein
MFNPKLCFLQNKLDLMIFLNENTDFNTLYYPNFSWRRILFNLAENLVKLNQVTEVSATFKRIIMKSME